jgi:hypothetical protein
VYRSIGGGTERRKGKEIERKERKENNERKEKKERTE